MVEYQLQIEALTPIHIGDGRELTLNIDFVKWRGTTYILNLDRFAQWAYERDSSTQWMSQKPGDVLSGNLTEMETANLYDYQLPGEPTHNKLRSFVKTVYAEPYLPGSSIKGLLRTIFVWGLYAARNRKPDLSRLNRNRSWAAQTVERDVMGANPNVDLFRAVHISDSQPLGLEALRVRSVDIYPTARQTQGGGIVVDVEVLREGITAQAKFHLDEYGFKDAARELGWAGKANWLAPGNLVALGKAFAEIRLKQEMDYFRPGEDVKTVRGFYRQLIDTYNQLGENQFIAQIGWGTGWNSKTFNTLLTEDRRNFVRLVRDYRMTRNSSSFDEETPFPKSRQLVRQQGIPVRPMGWVRVTVTEG
ncbi:MAG: type III-A CRISPR-associated RAMP protein Csm5 [Anaerolineae bacterium]|nr:type III-A CRISPR-associated RAMP protein Csm5 [Anaerolineae bacterium]